MPMAASDRVGRTQTVPSKDGEGADRDSGDEAHGSCGWGHLSTSDEEEDAEWQEAWEKVWDEVERQEEEEVERKGGGG